MLKIAAQIVLIIIVSALTSQAAIKTFRFSTVIDATPIGGPTNAPLTITYSFDTDLADGTGGFGTNSESGSYGPLLSLEINLAGQIVTGTGGGIFLWNHSSDGYDVRAETYSGYLYGRNIDFFRFLIVDVDTTMFSNKLLPTSPAFSLLGDFQQTSFDFTDGSSIQVSEFDNTPPAEHTPFSLTEVAEPGPVSNSMSGQYIGLVSHKINISPSQATATDTYKVTGHINSDGVGYFFRPDGTLILSKFYENNSVKVQMVSNGACYANPYTFRGRTLKFSILVSSYTSNQLATFNQTDTYAFTLTRTGR